jgi:hypothetical protein
MGANRLAGRFALLALAAASASDVFPAPAPARGDAAGVAALRRRVEQLRSERDLASGSAFYLRLDAGSGHLALVLQGVALDDYAAADLAWGVPRVVFVDRRPAPGWDTRSFSKGRLEPGRERDRIEVVAPPPSASPPSSGAPAAEATPSPPPIPKSAEETYSVPSPYRIVFAEGVSLEVRSRGAGSRNRSLFQRLGDALRLRFSDLATALSPRARERVRLRVTLEAEDAASLYRSLPPEVGLTVVGLPVR